MQSVRISDHREVVANVQGKEPLYTPRGKRPIDPCLIRINYGVDADTGKVWHIGVTVNGYPLNDRSGTAIQRHIPDLDTAPEWIRDTVAYFHPNQDGDDIEQAANELVEQTKIRRMSVENGAINMTLEAAHDIALAFIKAARTMIGDAPNYTETPIPPELMPAVELENHAAGEPDAYVFILQRVGKLTPHQARKQAEAERDTLAERMAAIAERLEPCSEQVLYHGNDMCPCGYGGTWPCPHTEAAWIARGLDPQQEVTRVLAELRPDGV